MYSGARSTADVQLQEVGEEAAAKQTIRSGKQAGERYGVACACWTYLLYLKLFHHLGPYLAYHKMLCYP